MPVPAPSPSIDDEDQQNWQDEQPAENVAPDSTDTAPDASPVPDAPMQDAAPVAAAPAQPAAPVAPPLWKDVKALPQFQQMTPQNQADAFTSWVQQSTDFLKAANAPRPAYGGFQAYVDKEGKNLGTSFIWNPDGTPQTIGQRNAIYGQPTDDAAQAALPFTVDIEKPSNNVVSTVERGLYGLVSGAAALFASAADGEAKVWDYVTGTAPNTDALDRGLALARQSNQEIMASQGGETPEESFGQAAGQTVSTFAGGSELISIAAIGAAEAMDQTYHNAIDQGATPVQAAVSSGVAAAVSAGTIAVLRPLNKLGLGAVLGDSAEAFENGAYRPTVAQAAKLMGLDAAGLAATGYGGQVLQNAADKRLYAPDRGLTDGALDAAGQASLFALIHAPTMLTALWGARSQISAAHQETSNALAARDAAHADGDPAKIQAAEAAYNDAAGNLQDLVDTTAKNAPPPTPEDAIEAQQIIKATPSATTSPLDAEIEATTQEAQKPGLPIVDDPGAPVAEEPKPATTEQASIVPEETAAGVGPMTEQTVKQVSNEPTAPEEEATEPDADKSEPAEQGSATETESAPDVAGIDESEVDPEIKAQVDQAVKANGTKQPVVYSEDQDSPAWADESQPGKVFVNPKAMSAALANLKTPEERTQYVQRVLHEEDIHDAQHAVEAKWKAEGTHQDNVEAYVGERTPEEIDQTVSTYGNDRIDPRKATSPTDLYDRQTLFMREHARQVLQRKLRGESTEDVWKQRGAPALARYLRALYTQVRQRIANFGADTFHTRYLKAIEDTLKDGGQPIVDSNANGGVTRAAEPPRTADDLTDGFYSQLGRTIAAKMPGRASADQVRSMLKGNGVKDDEIKWSGLDDYLKQHPQATKAEVQQFLKTEGGVRIQTHVLQEGSSRYAEYQLPGGTNYREQVFTLPGEGYKSSHFPGQENYLAHMRLNDRSDAEGKPGTFIEEMQSDRHQAGRERGYAGEAGLSPEEEKELAGLRSLNHVVSQGGGRLSSEQRARYADLTSRKNADSIRVTDAPFRKTWHEFLFRNALRDAVNAGHDWIGWTTGDMQADRFNLANQVNSVSFRREGEKYQLYAEPKGGEGEINLGVKSAEELPAVVGKGLADQIANHPEDSHTFDTGELKLATDQSRGMQGFYDKIVPDYVAKYTRKWGVKPELETLMVAGRSMDIDLDRPVQREDGRWQLQDGRGDVAEPNRSFDTEDDAWTAIDAESNGTSPNLPEKRLPVETKIWKLPINDAMRESVRTQGQPTFAARPPELRESDKPPTPDKFAEAQWKDTKGVFKRFADLTRAAAPPEYDRLGRKPGETFGSAMRDLASKLIGLKKYTPRLKALGDYMAENQEKLFTATKIHNFVEKSVPDLLERKAVMRWIEAKGDQATLQKWYDETPEKDLKPIYEAALSLSDEAKEVANKGVTLQEAKLQKGNVWGMKINRRDNYVPHYVIKDPDNVTSALGKGSSNALRISTDRSKQRVFDTMFEGERAGVRYSDDYADCLAAYSLEMDRAVASRKFMGALTKVDEDDGRKAVTPPVSGWQDFTKPDGGQVHVVYKGRPDEDHSDYVEVDIPAFKGVAWSGEVNGATVLRRDNMLVHPETAEFLNNIFGVNTPWWNEPASNPMKAIRNSLAKLAFQDVNSAFKSNLFLLSPFFHPIQLSFEALGHGVNPLSGVNPAQLLREVFDHRIGLDSGPLDYSDENVKDAIAHSLGATGSENVLDDEAATDMDNNILGWSEFLTRKMGVDKAADAIAYAKEANRRMQQILFKRFIPSIKYRTYQAALPRNLARLSKEVDSGKYTVDDVKYLTADQVNNAYGELNYAFLNRNPETQARLRFFLLAPDFFEARGRHLGQAITGVPGIGLRSGREQFLAMGYLALAQIVVAQGGGLLINGETDMSHPFDLRIGNRYYGIRTAAGDALGLFKDLWGFSSGVKGKGLPYLNNRLSPISRFLLELGTGHNWRGEKTSSFDAITDALSGNLPMFAQPFVSEIPGVGSFFATSRNNPVSPFEQVLGSLGVKISRYSPIQVVSGKAHDFANTHPELVGKEPDNGSHDVSPYRPLSYALDDGDYGAAYGEYQKLLAQAQKLNKTDPDAFISRGFRVSERHNFTGTRAGDAAFYQSLDKDGKAQVDAAKERRELLIKRFQVMVDTKGVGPVPPGGQ